MGAKKAKVKEVLVVEEDNTEEEDSIKSLPLFDGQSPDGITCLTVYRQEPIEEGSLGTVSKDADEATIKRRWGGGVYVIRARGGGGRFNSWQRTITIAGEPVFESDDARRRFGIKTGKIVPVEPPKEAAAAPAAPQQGVSVLEIITLMQKSQEQQIALMRLQMEQRDRESAAREERARREADEARERDRKADEQARERDRAFQTTMLQITQASQKQDSGSNLVNMLIKGVSLARELGGESGPTDPLALLAGNIGPIIEQIRGGVTSPQQPQQPQASAAPAGSIYLDPQMSARLRRAYDKLIGQGYSPQVAEKMAEEALLRGMQLLEGLPNAPAAPDPPPAPAPAPAPVTVAPPSLPNGAAGRNGTRGRARATR